MIIKGEMRLRSSRANDNKNVNMNDSANTNSKNLKSGWKED